jgi:AraC-like DNA-binding protein
MVMRDQRDLRYVRSPALPGVEFVEATFRGPAPAPVLLPQLTLVMCDEGGGEVGGGRQPLRIGAGEVAIRAPNQVAVTLRHAAPETRCRVLMVDPALLPPAELESRRLTRFGSLVTRSQPIVDGFFGLWQSMEMRAPAADQQERLASLLAPVIDLAAREAPRSPLLTPAVARTREALQQRFTEDVPLGELARLAGMSKCHLVHLFHKEVGLPPHAYQIQLRVARARVLVADGVPLAEVATLTGFSDQSHLTRLFKRVVGVPPGQYAALMGVHGPIASPPPPAPPSRPQPRSPMARPPVPPSPSTPSTTVPPTP